MTGCHLHNLLFIVLSLCLLRILCSNRATLSHFATQEHWVQASLILTTLFYWFKLCFNTSLKDFLWQSAVQLVFFSSSYPGFFGILLPSIFITWIGLQNNIKWKYLGYSESMNIQWLYCLKLYQSILLQKKNLGW